VTGALPVPAVRVLDTRKGVGLLTGRCRVHPGVPMHVPVLGIGGVPLTGVASVTLRVTVIRPDADTELRVWTPGTVAPATAALATAKRTDATTDVTVPVGTDGLVSLELAGGMGHLTVHTIGYTVGGTT
jgi:hypothetical protein